MDPGENDLQAAFRETEEEAGLKEQDLTVVEGFENVLRVGHIYITSKVTFNLFSFHLTPTFFLMGMVGLLSLLQS